MYKKSGRKLLSVLMTLAIVISLMPAMTLTANAAGATATVTFSSDDFKSSPTSLKKQCNSVDVTFSNSTGMSYDVDGLYAWEGAVSTYEESDVKLTIQIADGYTFDLTGFDMRANLGSASLTLTYWDGSTDTITATAGSKALLTSCTLSKAVNDVKKIVLTSDDYAVFQNFAIDDVKLVNAPMVTTQAVSSISTTMATGNGNITALGTSNPTAYGVCWNTTGMPTISDSKADNGVASATGAFTASMTGLTASTKYYVRAYATNTTGTNYGTEVNFTTSGAYDSNLLTNGDAGAGDLTGWTSTGSTFVALKTGIPTPLSSNKGNVFDYFPNAAGSETLSQTIDVSSFSTDIASGMVNVRLTSDARKCYSASDATIKLELLDASDGVLATYTKHCTSTNDATNDWETLTVNQSSIPNTTAKLKVSLIATISTAKLGQDYIEFDGVNLQLSKSVAAPTLNIQSASALTKASATLNFTSDLTGTYYYLVYAAGDTAPNAATIEAQGIAVAKGSGAASASNTINVTGLSAETVYKAYVVVRNMGGVSNVVTAPIYTSFTNGLGTLAAPYEIANAAELTYMSNVVNNCNGFYKDKCYKLTANIPLNITTGWASWTNSTSGLTSWTPIGNTESSIFSGTFDGNAKTVSGIYISTASDKAQGLFGYVSGSLVNLGVTESYIHAPYYIGGIAGKTTSTAGISNCYFSGKIDGTKNGSFSGFGGIVGYSDGTIMDCYNTGTVTGTGNDIGGIAGSSNNTISGCYNTGTVTGAANCVGGILGSCGDAATFCYNLGAVTGLNYVGGICGNNSGGTIMNCYNKALATATDGTLGCAGGISGFGGPSPLTNCYSTVMASGVKSGGLVGDATTANITYCYWESGASTGGAGSGSLDLSCTNKTTAEMQDAAFVLLLNTHKGSTGTKGWIIGGDSYPAFGTPSSIATLKAASTVKGQTVTGLGIPNATLGSETAGSVTITAAKAADTTEATTFITLFHNTDSGSAVKAVKYTSGTTDFSGFDGAAAYTNAVITDGDFFIVRVTAQDATVNYYRINVTVTPILSNDAGLTSVLSQAINAGSEAGTISDPKTASISVANGVSTVAASDIVKHNAGAVVTFYGTDNTYTNIAAGSVNLTAGSGTNVYIKVAAADSTTVYYKVTINREFAAVAPTVTTQAVSGISSTTATGNGNITALGTPNATAYGICWSTSTNPTTSDSKVDKGAASSTGAFTANMTGLTANTTYYVRAFATNTAGTSYGTEVSFTTSGVTPTATTNAASSVTSTAATLNGTVNANNANTTVTFEYGTTASYGTSVTAAQSPVTGTSVTSVSSAISGLTPNTTYHFRVKSVNTAGTTYGADTAFTTSAIAPTATTNAASSVTSTGATLNGTVNANNASTTVTFEFGTTESYGTSLTAVPSSVTGTSATSVNCYSIGLIPNTTYHFRVKSVNTAGTTYGADTTFTTSAFTPTATTNDASSVTSTGATLNGTVNANNASTTVTFEFGTTESYGTSLTAVPSSVTGTSATSVSSAIAGLTPNTTYHFRVKSVNTAGTTYGADTTFTTSAIAPTAATNAASSVSQTGATFNGTVNANNASTTVTFEFGTGESYGNSVLASPSTVTGTSATSVSAAIAVLAPNTTYHFRVKSVNTAGTTYGADTTFKTGAGFPSVTTNAVSSVTSTGATLNGDVYANGASTEVTFEYGTTTSYGTSVTAVQSPVTGTGTASVSYSLTGLTPNTTYHFRVVGVNTAGARYGTDLTFTTSAVPTVTTQDVSGISSTTAMGNGNITALGTPNPTAYGVCWSTSANPTTSDSKVDKGAASSTGAFTANMTGLTANTTYYVRAFATNTEGTSYGTEVSFTTTAIAPTATTNAASSVSQTGATLNGTVNANNANTTVTFEYGTTASYGSSSTAAQSPVTGTNATSVSSAISGLTPNTTYHFRVKSVNTAGSTYGDDTMFTTSAIAPAATTNAASSVNSTAATLNGTVNANNANTVVMFEYGTTTSYGTSVTAVQSPATGTSATSVSCSLTGLTPNTTYHFRVKSVNMAGTTNGIDLTFTTALSSDATLTSVLSQAINAGSEAGTIGEPKTASISVANGVSTVAASDIVKHDAGAVVTFYGMDNTYTNIAASSVNLTAGSGTNIYIKVAAADSTTMYYKVTINRAPGGGSTPPPTPPAPQPSGTGVEILVNGKTETAATATTTQEGNKTITTVAVDDKKVEEKLQAEGNNATVTIPVKNNADVVVGQLNGQTVKNMETKEAVLEIKTENVTYTLPASQINIDNVSEQIGQQVELKDIKVNVTISAPPADTAKVVEDTANKNNYQVVVKPVEFNITCSSGNKTVEVSKFNGYVDRMVAIPDGIDPSKITTGIVLNSDGTFSHVPTSIVRVDGKYYAKINSLTNSTYSVIYSPKVFKDVENHWAKDAVNDMASRLVISGVGNDSFAPDKDITRAEFAAIIVRSLGLMHPGIGKSSFSDVSKSDWYYDAVSIAYEYGIISGYGNGKFGPNDKITHEQAMAMIANAMKITKLKADFKSGEAEQIIASYGDFKKASSWAKNSIALCVKMGVLPDGSGKLATPKDNITRAEVAVIVQRLLKKSGLI